MKTFQEYITESVEENEKYIDKIVRDCMPFLDEINFRPKSNVLYRGMKEGSKRLLQKSVRKDRKPVDTPEILHDTVDDIFEKNFGFKARSNVLMATGFKGYAMNYGDLYAVFPIGRFDYIWSDNIPDLYSTKFLKEVVGVLKKEFPDFSKELAQHHEIHRFTNFFVFEKILKDEDGGSYANIMLKYFGKEDIIRAFEKVIKENYQKNTGLEKYLDDTRMNEMLISCDSYYAVHTNVMREVRDGLSFQEKLYNKYTGKE